MSQEISLEHTIYSVTNDCPVCHAHESEPAVQCANCGAVLVRGLRRGTVIADTYQYICPIGTGGMGLIVKAIDKKSKDEVAVKLLLLNTSVSDNRRFQQEAKAASMLTHKNIIHVRDFGFCEDDSPYMVMDYVVGDNLANVIAKSGSLPLGDALDIFDQICDAMIFAHSKGVVHRDLKPSNIMLTGPNRDFVKIVDFGIAKILDENSLEKNLTKTGQVIGSPLYMSPEQALGRKVDRRTDIYSAGCVLFHALTGAPPLEGSSAIETLFKHLNQTPLTLSVASLGKNFPQNLEEIVAKSLRKEPDDRYQSFEELRSDLHNAKIGRSSPDGIAGQNIEATNGTHWLTKKHVIVAIACSALLVTSSAVWFWSKQNSQSNRKTSKLFSVPSQTGNQNKEASTSEHSANPKTDKERSTDDFSSWKNVSQRLIDTNIESSRSNYNLNDPITSNEDLSYLLDRIKKTGAPIDALNVDPKKQLCRVSNSGLSGLHRLQLTELTLNNTIVTGDGLAEIARIKTLQELHLPGLRQTNSQNLMFLKELKNLRILGLNRCEELTGGDLVVLTHMPGLTSLNLASDPKLGDDGMPYIASLPNLVKLTIGKTNLHDQGLKRLARVKSLRTLGLGGCPINGEGLAPLAKLPQLLNLNLSHSQIDSRAVKALCQFRALKWLFVANCPNLTEKDISQLKAVLGSNCVITTGRRPIGTACSRMSQEISLENSIYSVCADCPDCGEHQPEPAMQCLSCGTMLVKGLRSGTVIAARYEYIEPIGSGGMGLIVKAVDRTTGKEVAVKLLLHNESAADNRRFQVEAKAASMLTHKHIIHVVDFGLWDVHSPYMVMDYVVGHNLDNVIAKKGSLEVIETLEIFDQICDAMDYAHSKRIVHRDLKPSNIMLTGSNQDFVKIVDFGIAKILDKTTLEKSLTQTGQLIGSPLYMSPEQAGGNKVDVRTDIYSAGCVLYHALSGAPPLEGKTTIETLFMHLHNVPPSMSEVSLGKKFDPVLEEIVAKALGKNPDERYQSFAALRADLEKAYPDGTQAPVEIVAPPKKSPKNVVVGGVIAAALVAACGTAVYYVVNAHKPQPAVVPTPAAVANTPPSVAATPAAVQPITRSKSAPAEHDPSADGLVLGKDVVNRLIETNIRNRDPVFRLGHLRDISDGDVGFLAREIRRNHAPIEVLELTSTPITDDAIAQITELPIKTLILENTTMVKGYALRDIGRIETLETLNLSGVKGITPHDLTQLINLKSLRSLNLSFSNIGAADCGIISKMPKLERLDLHAMPQFKDTDAFANISKQHTISNLTLDYSELSDDGLKYISNMKSLRTLSIAGAHTSNKGLDYLAKLPALNQLNLSQTPINHDSVPRLKKLKHLTRLVVWKCDSLSAGDVKELRAKFGAETVSQKQPGQNWDTE